MKKNKIILSLSLGLLLTSCNQANTQSKDKVSEETISQALDGQSQTSESSKDANKSKDQKDKKGKLDYDDWRKIIVDMGEFSPTLAKNLTDDQIQELVDEATEKSEETGYWDVKDFVFQELSKQYPELSDKFPLDTIERRENWVASEEGANTDKFEYERRLISDLGYDSSKVWSVDDKAIEDAFHKAYEDNPELYYDDYVKNAAADLFSDPNDSNDDKDIKENKEESQKVEETNTSEDTKTTDTEENIESEDTSEESNDDSNNNGIKKYGSSQTDYDAIKTALVQYYEFSPSSVNQMSNEDIDLAYTRAMNRLEETGFGDIGLIFEELGKMYPGSSTMYPGDTSESSETNN